VQGKAQAVKQKRYSAQFQRAAVERMKANSSVSIDELARQLGVSKRALYKWRAKWWVRLHGAADSQAVPEQELELRRQVDQLKHALAAKTLEVDFFKGALQKIEARRRPSGRSGETASSRKSAK
jgi:transposase-like protein